LRRVLVRSAFGFGIRRCVPLRAALVAGHAVLAERREAVAVATAVRIGARLAVRLVRRGRGCAPLVVLVGHRGLLIARGCVIARLSPGAAAGPVRDPGRNPDPVAAAHPAAARAPVFPGWPDAVPAWGAAVPVRC